MSDDGTRIRAIQGHTMARYIISDLYDEIKTCEEFRNHPRWAGSVPDHLVLEISNENRLDQWSRAKIYPPPMKNRFHTMRAVCGTGKQEFGPKDIILYAFINVEELYNNVPHIEIYMTGGGRIVTHRNIPSSLRSRER